jgi:peptidoglycan/LPS O-acetylase OafA/YrhL
MMETILRDLQQPEYLHTLINPLPIYGLVVAFCGLAATLVFRIRSARVVALSLIFICALSAWPAAHFGEEAYDRVLSMADENGQAWLKEHNRRADELVWVFYVLAAVAIAAIVAPKKWPRSSTPLAVATLICAAAALGGGGYIAHAGGKIRHREFRNASPPPAPSESG